MKHSWTERLQTRNNHAEIARFYDAYKVPCAEAVIDFINRFCFTVDPRKTDDRILPFELFPKQVEYIYYLWRKYTNRDDGVVDKCRGVGMSWMNAAFSTYLLLFQKSVTISMYTYKATECHELGNIDTLLEKVVFLCDQLPAYFTRGITHKLMQVSCSKTKSIIIGKSGDTPGRGGRSSIYFLDECAFYPRADSIEAAVSRNADCKIWGSTHHGTNTLFFRKCTGGANEVFVIDWWEIPLYNQAWYEKEKAKAEAEGTLHIFKQEVERDASASLESVVIPAEWVNAAKRCTANLSGKIIAGLDPANEGGDTHGFIVINGNMPIYADESGEGDPADATDNYYWQAVEMNAEEFRYDPIGVGVGVTIRLKQIAEELKGSLQEITGKLSGLKMPGDAKKILQLNKQKTRYNKALKMRVVAWSASGAVMRPTEMDFAEKENGELFENAKAQAWWKVRSEFLNTYRSVNNKDKVKEDELITFPDVITLKMEKLIRELSQPQFTNSKRGKTMIDKKPKGTKSPNLADAYIICRAEVEPEWLSWAEY